MTTAVAIHSFTHGSIIKGDAIKRVTLLLGALVALAGTATFAQSGASESASSAAQATPAANAITEGEVRKVDKENKKLTIKHGEIKNLEMPGMTMVFQVKDPAMLETVKPGDKVRFKADRAGGALVVTELQVTR